MPKTYFSLLSAVSALQRLHTPAQSAGHLGRSHLAAGVGSIAILAFLAQPVAHQDAAARVLTNLSDAERWSHVVTAAPVGSVHAATFDLRNVDSEITGGIGNTGGVRGKTGRALSMDGAGAIAIQGMAAPDLGPQRANEAIKGDRVVQRLHDQAPPVFRAGSLVKSASLLSGPDAAGKSVARFVPDAAPKLKAGALKAGTKGQTLTADQKIEVATTFHIKEAPIRRARAAVPTMLASLVTGPGDEYVLGYAPEPDYTSDSPFDAILVEPAKPKRFVPPAGKRDHGWVKNPLPVYAFSGKQQKCLAEGIYFEARGEPVRGQAAVAQVILNRVRNPAFPGTICGVVYQNRNWRNRCQFSFACDRIRDRIGNPKLYRDIVEVASATTSGKIWLDEVGSSTHYHATYVRPRWARKMTRLTRIGKHIFYRSINGGWS
ncbi:MAG: cell wall hydrolase [Pseudomonadota bacterium]